MGCGKLTEKKSKSKAFENRLMDVYKPYPYK